MTIVRILDFDLTDADRFLSAQKVLGRMLTEGWKIETSCRSETWITVILSRPGCEGDLDKKSDLKPQELIQHGNL